MKRYSYFFLLVLVVIVSFPINSLASGLVIPSSETSNGSIGLVGTIPSPPPTQAATIAVPVNQANFTSSPITISGLCPTGLLIKIFSNNIFVGSTQCLNGTYSLSIDLFGGQNNLTAIDYDSLDQSGPVSNAVIVSYNDALLANFGSVVSLTSNYAKRGADPNQPLDWPFLLSGGTGPYAISINWGDNSPTDLISQQFSGTINASHIYKTAGTFNIIIKATDKNNTQAFLQVVGVANGAVTLSTTNSSQGSTLVNNQKPQVIWWPAASMVPLILVSFWIGGKYQLVALRRQLEKQRS